MDKEKDKDMEKDKASAVVPAYPALPNSPDENQISMGLKGLKVSNKEAQGVQAPKKNFIKLTGHLKVQAFFFAALCSYRSLVVTLQLR